MAPDTVDGNECSKTVKGRIGTISADNLVAHDIGGFRKTFSSGQVYRFCMITHENLPKFHSESDHDSRCCA